MYVSTRLDARLNIPVLLSPASAVIPSGNGGVNVIIEQSSHFMAWVEQNTIGDKLLSNL